MSRKPIIVPPKKTLTEAANEFAVAWCDWHNNPHVQLDDEVVSAGHELVEALGLMMNENPETGKFELVKA